MKKFIFLQRASISKLKRSGVSLSGVNFKGCDMKNGSLSKKRRINDELASKKQE